jgi:hypothetical protein
MEKAGLSYYDLQAPLNNPSFRSRLIKFWHDETKNDDWFTCQTTTKTLRELVQTNPSLLDQDQEARWWNESFAKARGKVRRLTLRTTSVPRSWSKTLDEQKTLLGKNESVPWIRDVVDGVVQYYQATGKRIFRGYYVRTNDMDSNGRRVMIGYFRSVGLYVITDWVDDRSDNIGLAASQKSRTPWF